MCIMYVWYMCVCEMYMYVGIYITSLGAIGNQ